MKADVEVYVYAFCGECGAELDTSGNDVEAVQVEPCETCLEKASKTAYDEGCDEGYGIGLNEGKLE
jgi:hypothetical protein